MLKIISSWDSQSGINWLNWPRNMKKMSKEPLCWESRCKLDLSCGLLALLKFYTARPINKRSTFCLTVLMEVLYLLLFNRLKKSSAASNLVELFRLPHVWNMPLNIKSYKMNQQKFSAKNLCKRKQKNLPIFQHVTS